MKIYVNIKVTLDDDWNMRKLKIHLIIKKNIQD